MLGKYDAGPFSFSPAGGSGGSGIFGTFFMDAPPRF
jgi:hypothetical protein